MKHNRKLLLSTGLVMATLVGASYYAGNSLQGRFIGALDDGDGDTLTDSQEFKYGTDPKNADTDDDGLSDADEIMKYQSNPLDADTDDDGLNDGDEVEAGTLLKDSDTDNDGINDGGLPE